MTEHTGRFHASRPTDPRRQRLTLNQLLGEVAAPPLWSGRTVRPHSPAQHRRPAELRFPAALRLPQGLRIPAGASRSVRSPEPPRLLILRFGLAVACMTLIVLGVGTTFLPRPAPLNEDSVSPAAVSTRAPEIGVPPAPTLVPGAHPYQYPAWVEPSEDSPPYNPEIGNPGPFPEPAVLRGP